MSSKLLSVKINEKFSDLLLAQSYEVIRNLKVRYTGHKAKVGNLCEWLFTSK